MGDEQNTQLKMPFWKTRSFERFIRGAGALAFTILAPQLPLLFDATMATIPSQYSVLVTPLINAAFKNWRMKHPDNKWLKYFPM